MAEASTTHIVVDDYGHLVAATLIRRNPVDCFGFSSDMDNIDHESRGEGHAAEPEEMA